ncbi:macrophage mannose receptor 1-like isoform X1 [Leguminivora glycinivorella]|uniref:macrophage mannose receptor 1-like isoform X1 n=1 Tax=Leguminivora glycinivorella TaxID=1035111 RepID=UPI00200C1ED9|nr:macrophage mannose receptor 1-like isoform X1 [Leguminivora glycinivorella]
MCKTYCFILTSVILLQGKATGGPVRMGYEYMPEEDAWLRLHIEPAIWPDARLRCHLEGGALASPTTSAMTKALVAMLAANKMTMRHAYIGVHALLSKGEFMSMEGIPMGNLSARWREGEPNNMKNEEDCVVLDGAGEAIDVSCSTPRPYFCRKESTRMIVNKCGTTADGYKLEPRTGSCYKFHLVPRTWHRAAMACQAEGGHLAVINSNKEAQALKDIFGEHPITSIKGGNVLEANVGIWDWNEHGEWLTIFGQTLSEAGYEGWRHNEPNNVEKEFCGAIDRDGYLNNCPCDRFALFICEVTPK